MHFSQTGFAQEWWQTFRKYAYFWIHSLKYAFFYFCGSHEKSPTLHSSFLFLTNDFIGINDETTMATQTTY
jgi:hypothetical protein